MIGSVISKLFLATIIFFFGKTIVIELSSTYLEIIGFKVSKTILVYLIFLSSISLLNLFFWSLYLLISFFNILTSLSNSSFSTIFFF